MCELNKASQSLKITITVYTVMKSAYYVAKNSKEPAGRRMHRLSEEQITIMIIEHFLDLEQRIILPSVPKSVYSKTHP